MSKHKRLNRRETIKVLASGPALPMLAQIPLPRVSPPHARPHSLVLPEKEERPWSPKFFNAHQNETVTAVAELIIPQTETPGAKAAKVNEFIDLVLSEETSTVQQEFLRGLDWMDQKSNELFGSRFIELNPKQQATLLEAISSSENKIPGDQAGVTFFKDIKNRTIFAYYTSEVGIHQELQYKGLDYLTEFPGCNHPEHLDWDPKA